MRNLLIMIALMFLFLVWVTYKIDKIEAGLRKPETQKEKYND